MGLQAASVWQSWVCIKWCINETSKAHHNVVSVYTYMAQAALEFAVSGHVSID